MDHLSSVDAAFLHLETPETPMHVGSLMLLELPKGYRGDYFEDVKAMVAQRMHLCSIFHRKLAQMPFELADPVWIEDDDVDLDYHVRSVTLRKPGSMAQLEQLVARLHSTLLDRSRPLWEVYVIEGLGGEHEGQVAYYSKAHHSGIDGKAGVELAKVFYDLTPTVREVKPPRARAAHGSYQLGVAELLQAAVSNTLSQYVKAVKMIPKAVKGLAAGVKIIASRRREPGERSLNIGLASRTIFNASITNQRSYATLSLPLEDMKALGKRVGGTVNTIVMAMCASALRRFLLERDALPTKALVAAVPVSLRTADDSSMNNQVSMIRVDLATDLADPAERFRAIHLSSEAAKSVVATLKPVLATDVPITGSPWLMSGLASLFGRSGLANRLPALANVTISNVPGLPVPLYVAGASMLHYYPVSIPYHSAALNITVQSYAGTMEFGITACRRVLSQAQAQELVELLKAALREIEALEPVAAADDAAKVAVDSAPAKQARATAPKRTRAAAKAAIQPASRPASKRATRTAARAPVKIAAPTRRTANA